MRLIFIAVGIVLLMSSCQGQGKEETQNVSSGIKKGILQEAIQTSNYTYLRLQDNGEDTWLAVPKMKADLGETYYYQGGMEMKNFHSKELGRDFDRVLFIEKVAKSEEDLNSDNQENYRSNIKSSIVKSVTKLEPAKDGITIAELFANKEKYVGKTVKIKGQVTKYNAAIMKKNWVHIQDGTEYDGKFDLVFTSDQEFKVGDVVTIEGEVSLNKDFGYGYSYEILIENAVKK